METYLTKKTKDKVKGLGYYQIIGGVIGIISTIGLIAQVGTIKWLVVLLFLLAAGLYSFSIYCGQQLLKGRLKTALKLSTINQALQSINFAILGFAFKFIAGVTLLIGIDYTNDFNITFHFSLSQFQLNINNEKVLLTVGFNLVAVYLIYFIDKLQQKIE